MARADLHVHSSASDGLFPPREVLRRAHGVGLGAVALTDHDTVAGLAEALHEARSLGIDFVPGCEISITAEGLDVHLLAYCIDAQHPRLTALLQTIHEDRVGRVREMVRRLNASGATLTMDEIVRQAAGSQSIGRMHVARALVARGIVPNVAQAFRRWIGSGGDSYVPKQTPGVEETLAVVRAAGGVAVLGHPALYGIAEVAERFAQWEIDGIEVYHPAHDAADVERLLAWARQRGCIVTGGSDWHGDQRPEAYIGSTTVDDAVVDQLRALASRGRRPSRTSRARAEAVPAPDALGDRARGSLGRRASGPREGGRSRGT